MSYIHLTVKNEGGVVGVQFPAGVLTKGIKVTEFEQQLLEELRKINRRLAQIAEQTKPTTYVQGVEVHGTIDNADVRW